MNIDNDIKPFNLFELPKERNIKTSEGGMGTKQRKKARYNSINP